MSARTTTLAVLGLYVACPGEGQIKDLSPPR